MDRRRICLSLIALSLTACSSSEYRHQARGDFDYVNVKASEQLQVPNNLNAVTTNRLYDIPTLKHSAGSVGGAVDVRAPSQVLPLAAGSRVDEFDKSAAIWFDKIDDSRDLRQQVIRAITSYIEDEGVAILHSDEANNVWHSDWFAKNSESGALFWQSIDSTESWRFAYSLVTKPHGRAVGLNVELLDYMRTDEDSTVKNISALEKQRVEIAMVNAITSQLDYLYRINSREDRLARADMEIVSKTLSKDGEPAIAIDYPADDVWTYLPGFFEENNFTITDLDEDKRIYEVNYTYVDPSIWSKMWGGESSVLTLQDGAYRFNVQQEGSKTLLVITDKDKQNIGQQVIDDNFALLKSGLAFQ